MALPSPLSPGDKAPEFSFKDRSGNARHTRDLAGQTYLVYFYPKDDTPGCTKEACAFRDRFDEFDRAGVTVIGVSPDDDRSHEKFREKYNLPFPLASDVDKSISRQYGVWGPKTFMGKKYEGVHRTSFLVGKDGTIARTYPSVKPDVHAGEVMKDIDALNVK